MSNNKQLRIARNAGIARFAAALLIVFTLAGTSSSQTVNFPITSSTDDGTGTIAGSLSFCLLISNQLGGNNAITLTIDESIDTISVSGSLPRITNNVTIVGNGATIQGNGNRLFFVESGTVAFQNLTIAGGTAQGGDGGNGGFGGGGGGGLGAGGALFVNSGANVTIQDVVFDDNRAIGGNAGTTNSANLFAHGGGGGGGFVTRGGDGGQNSGAGGGGFVGNGADGGNGDGGIGSGGTPGGEAPDTFSIRDPNGDNADAPFNGGGGGAWMGSGGAGADFGGGGGGGGNDFGGAGGFGGGGGGAGAAATAPGLGGFGGGNGGDGNNEIGAGGGSGFGGAVFVRAGGLLTIIDSSTNANTVTAGAGDGSTLNPGPSGQTAGSDLYVMGTLLTFDGEGLTTLTGSISGDGILIKQGTGALVLEGVSDYIGSTTVFGGLLAVNGSIASDTAIESGGALGGNGTIHGNVTNRGTLAPGASIGTLTIDGDLGSLGILQIDIDDGGNTAGINNDFVIVNGYVALEGILNVIAEPGTYTPGTTYHIVHAANSIDAFLGEIIDDLPGYHFSMIYQDNDVFMQLLNGDTDFSAIAGTPNQAGVGGYIEENNLNAHGDFQDLISELNLLTTSQQQAALEQLTPQATGTIAQLGVQNATNLNLLLSRQVRPGANGGGGDTSSAEEDEIAANRALSPEARAFLASFQQDAEPDVVRGQDCCYGCDWSAWAVSYGMGGVGQDDGNAAGGNYSMGGVLIALERSLDENHLLGIYGAYNSFSLSTDGPQQNANASDGQFGAYYRGGDGCNYHLLSASLGPDNYNTTRVIDIGGIGGQAEGDFSGWQSSVWLERGIVIERCCWSLQPLAALNYIFLRQNGYTETGPTIGNLDVAGTDTNALRGVLGAYLSRTLVMRNCQVLKPEVRAFWLHEFLEPETIVSASFAAIGGPSFATQGLNFGRDWAVVGAGLRWEFNDQLSLTANYDLQVNARQSSNYGSAGLQYAW